MKTRRNWFVFSLLGGIYQEVAAIVQTRRYMKRAFWAMWFVLLLASIPAIALPNVSLEESQQVNWFLICFQAMLCVVLGGSAVFSGTVSRYLRARGWVAPPHAPHVVPFVPSLITLLAFPLYLLAMTGLFLQIGCLEPQVFPSTTPLDILLMVVDNICRCSLFFDGFEIFHLRFGPEPIGWAPVTIVFLTRLLLSFGFVKLGFSLLSAAYYRTLGFEASDDKLSKIHGALRKSDLGELRYLCRGVGQTMSETFDELRRRDVEGGENAAISRKLLVVMKTTAAPYFERLASALPLSSPQRSEIAAYAETLRAEPDYVTPTRYRPLFFRFEVPLLLITQAVLLVMSLALVGQMTIPLGHIQEVADSWRNPHSASGILLFAAALLSTWLPFLGGRRVSRLATRFLAIALFVIQGMLVFATLAANEAIAIPSLFPEMLQDTSLYHEYGEICTISLFIVSVGMMCCGGSRTVGTVRRGTRLLLFAIQVLVLGAMFNYTGDIPASGLATEWSLWSVQFHDALPYLGLFVFLGLSVLIASASSETPHITLKTPLLVLLFAFPLLLVLCVLVLGGTLPTTVVALQQLFDSCEHPDYVRCVLSLIAALFSGGLLVFSHSWIRWLTKHGVFHVCVSSALRRRTLVWSLAATVLFILSTSAFLESVQSVSPDVLTRANADIGDVDMREAFIFVSGNFLLTEPLVDSYELFGPYWGASPSRLTQAGWLGGALVLMFRIVLDLSLIAMLAHIIQVWWNRTFNDLNVAPNTDLQLRLDALSEDASENPLLEAIVYDHFFSIRMFFRKRIPRYFHDPERTAALVSTSMCDTHVRDYLEVLRDRGKTDVLTAITSVDKIHANVSVLARDKNYALEIACQEAAIEICRHYATPSAPPLFKTALASLLTERATTLVLQGRGKDAFALYDEAIERFHSLQNEGAIEKADPRAGGAEMGRAAVLRALGDVGGSVETLNRQIAAMPKDLEDPDMLRYKAMLLEHKGMSLRKQNNLTAALEALNEAVAIIESLPATKRNEGDFAVVLYHERANVLLLKTDLEGARKDHQCAITILKYRAERGLDVRARLGDELCSMATVLEDQQRLEESLNASNEGIALIHNALRDGQKHVRSHLAMSLMNQGRVKSHSGEFSAALDDCTHAIDIWRTLIDEGNTEVISPMALGLINRGNLFLRHKQPEDALADYDEAISMCEALQERASSGELEKRIRTAKNVRKEALLLLPDDHPQRREIEAERDIDDVLREAHDLAEKGVFHEAIRFYDKAIEQLNAAISQGHADYLPGLALAIMNKGVSYAKWQKPHLAAPEFERSVNVYRELKDGSQSDFRSELACALVNLGKACVQLLEVSKVAMKALGLDEVCTNRDADAEVFLTVMESTNEAIALCNDLKREGRNYDSEIITTVRMLQQRARACHSS